MNFGYVYFKDPARKELYVSLLNDIGHIIDADQIRGQEEHYRKILNSDHEMKMCKVIFTDNYLKTEVIAAGTFNKPVDQFLKKLSPEEQIKLFDDFYDVYVNQFKH